MRFLLRIIGFIGLMSILMIGFSILYGRLFPVPIIEWASITLYWHDSRTGVNYSMLQPRDPTTTVLLVSGVQFVESPNQVYRMTLMGNARGIDVLVTDSAGETLQLLTSDLDINISNVTWLDDRHILIIRVTFVTGDFELTRLNVETGEERLFGTYGNSLYVLSPDRNWLLLNERATGYAEVINMWDERRYQINEASTSYAWSSNGHYFASRSLINGELRFQLFNTVTGDLLIDDFVPSRVVWSSNNRDVLLHNQQSILVYRDMNRILDHDFEHSIRKVAWSPDGNYAFILTQAETEFQLFLLDISSEQPIRLLTTLPDNVQLNSILWGGDSPILIYVFNPNDGNQSAVYSVQLSDGTSERITTIPSRIRQVRYLNTLEVK